MGALKDLYQSIQEELGDSRFFSHTSEKPFTEKVRRETIRHYVSNELFNLECLLLLNPQQKDALFLSHGEGEDAPFDELELIVKNNVSAKKHMNTVKECIADLDEISTADSKEETKRLHKDELSQKVINMLHVQTAKVAILAGADESEADWFLKQPRSFIQAALVANDREKDAFDDVQIKSDLSTVDLDCHEYLRKPHSNSRWTTIRAEDNNFNVDAQKLMEDIHAWEASMKGATGKEQEELKRKKERAEKILLKATNARNSALRDAFRSGDISDYYYRQRSEQLEKRDYTRVPEMFEVDALKDREQYLKSHDLQDLSKEEGDVICDLALKRAEKDKEVYLKKEFLSERGLSRSGRYLVSEMAVNKDVFYRGLTTKEALQEEDKNEGCRISIDLDEPGEDYIGMTMRQTPSPGEKERSLKK